MTTTLTIKNSTSTYKQTQILNSNRKSGRNKSLSVEDNNVQIEDPSIKEIKHKKHKVIRLVKEQIELLRLRQFDFDQELAGAKNKLWWDLQKNNLYKFAIASIALLFLWATLVLFGAAICNLYNADCTCYNNFWFLPWFAQRKEYQLVF